MGKPSETSRNPIVMFQGILPLGNIKIGHEVIAGITLAAIAIPEVMGYTKISGTPVITGLYTILIPSLLYAIFASSRHLVVGADSATAAILASGLAAMSIIDPGDYMALAGILALLSALLLILARIFKLGFLANFLSRSVLIGFLTGVGIQVAMGEFSGIFGIHGHGPAMEKFLYFLTHLSDIHVPSLLLAITSLTIILVCSRISNRLPGPLFAVVAAMFLAWAFTLDQSGIHLLGELPSGLPSLSIPDIPALTTNRIVNLLGIAISMFVVILAQSAATSRAYANRYNERYNADVDLVGLAAANIGAGLTGTFVVNGSPTKTEILDSSGGRTQLAQIASVATVLFVLLFLTAPLAYMPDVVLSVIVFLIGVKLIDVKGMKELFIQTRAEFWIAAATAAIVVLVGVKEGILFAVITSLLDHVRTGYNPRTYVLARREDGKVVFKHVDAVDELEKGLVVYCFTHSLYYANAEAFQEDVETIEAKMGDRMKVLCIQSAAISEIDFSAAQMLKHLIARLQGDGVRVVFAIVTPHVKKQMRRYGLTALLGHHAFVETIGDLSKITEATDANKK